MLLVLAAVAVTLGTVVNAGYRSALFRIDHSGLVQGDDGLIRGDMHCVCRVANSPWVSRFVCRVERADNANLIRIVDHLESASPIEVSYRDWSVLDLFAREDPYAMFLTRRLGFRPEDIVGQVMLEDESVILIRETKPGGQ